MNLSRSPAQSSALRRTAGPYILAQSPRRCFTARQECFESRHFEVKRNGDVLWAVSCLVARNFDGGVGPPMPSAPTLSTALMVTWRTSGDCVRAPFATILFHSIFGLVCRRSGTPAAMQRPAICHSMTRMQNSAPWRVALAASRPSPSSRRNHRLELGAYTGCRVTRCRAAGNSLPLFYSPATPSSETSSSQSLRDLGELCRASVQQADV